MLWACMDASKLTPLQYVQNKPFGFKMADKIEIIPNWVLDFKQKLIDK